MATILGNFTGPQPIIYTFREGFSKIETRFRICHGFFETFGPAYVNALGRKNRSGTTLHKESRTWIIDRYLTCEGPTAISTATRATPGAVYNVSFDIMKRSVHLRRSVKGDEIILLNFHATFLNLLNFSNRRKLGYMSRWQNRERLLSDRICNRRSTGHRSVIWEPACMELKFDWK